MKKLYLTRLSHLTIMILLIMGSTELFAQGYSGGSGTVGDPYQIANKTDLKYLSENSGEWSKHFIQTANIVFADADFQSGGDFYNGGAGFIPIGTYAINFTGSYQGNAKTISNLKIFRSSQDFVGFFGDINGGPVSKLGLNDIHIEGHQYVGGCAGWIQGGNFSECYTTGSVIGMNEVGGFAGFSYGTISNSYSRASVSPNYYINNYLSGFVGVGNSPGNITNCFSAGQNTGTYFAGGFFGNQVTTTTYAGNFWDVQISGQTLGNCATGKTTSQMKTMSTYTSAGWDFAGETTNGTNDLWTLNCSDNGGYPALAWQGFLNTSFAVIYDGNDNTGGTVPVDGTCYASGNIVTVLGNTGSLIKTGYTFNGWNTAANGSGTSYAPGATFAMPAYNLTLYVQWQINPPGYSGGDGTSGNPYQIANKTDLKYLSEHSSDWGMHFIQTADIILSAADFQVGGDFYNGGTGFIPIGTKGGINFTGTYNGQGHIIANLKINRPISYFQALFGAVNGAEIKRLGLIDADIKAPTGSVAASFVAENNNSTISECFATGSVSAVMTPGGFVGVNNGGTITNCYSRCSVTSTDGMMGGFPGGFAGYNYGTITKSYASGLLSSRVGLEYGFCTSSTGTISDCFWDTETTGTNSSNGGTGKTTAEMKTVSTFTNAGWDFIGETTNGTNDYWIISTGTNDGYPAFTWQLSGFTVTYDGNTNTGGTAPVDGSSPYQANSTVTVLGNTGNLVKSGYTFDGWNTAANGSGTAYAAGATFTMPSANVTLYAQWKCIVTIPDQNFKNYLVGNVTINTNQDTEIQCSEATAFTGSIDVTNKSISDLTGIEAFVNITGLYCGHNTLSSLDVSANTALETLHANYNQLTTLDLTNNAALKYLDLTQNQLSGLNIGGNTALVHLFCGNNTLSALDVSVNPDLTIIHAYNNALGTFDVSANPDLAEFEVYNNTLTVLNVKNGNNINITAFNCLGNPSLSCIQVDNAAWSATNWPNKPAGAVYNENCTPFTVTYDGNGNTGGSVPVDANSPYLSNATVTVLGNTGNLVNTGLTFNGWNTAANGSGTAYAAGATFTMPANNVTLYAQWWCIITIPDQNFKNYLINNTAINTNQDTEIQCSEAAAYNGSIDVTNKSISDLTGIEAFVGITGLFCGQNTLSSLDVSANTALETLHANYNQLTALDLTNNAALKYLDLTQNQLSGLNLSGNTALVHLFCGNNALSALDVSVNPDLTIIHAYNNALGTFDVSANPDLVAFEVYNNALIALNVKNGNNANITAFNCLGNPNLSCIQVDDAAWSTTNWPNKPAGAVYSENCTAYTVTYDGNGHTGGTVPVDPNAPYLANATVMVMGNNGFLVKTGFAFNGWNTAANGSGTAYAAYATFTMPLNNVTLYAQWLPEFTPGEIQVTGETICYNGTPAEIGSVTSAGGGDGTITYAWRSSADNFGSDISGATLSTYTPPSGLTATTSYQRYSHDGTVQTTFVQSTGTWTVTVRPEFTAGTIATAGETICYNTSPGQAIGNEGSGSGGDGTITYSWRSSADSYVSDISGAAGATYTPAGPLTSTTSYKRYAKDNTCNTTPTASTGTWTVTVQSEFTPGAIATAGETICYNTSPAQAIGNEASGSGGDGTITYSWRSSADSYASDISGANGATYTPAGPLTSATSYKRYAKDNTCNTTPAASTGTWTVTVRPEFTPGAIATTGETICHNTNPSVAIGNSVSASGGGGTISYSWRSSVTNFTTAIPGATGSTYTPWGPLTKTTSYKRYAKDNTCNTNPTVSTGIWTVTVVVSSGGTVNGGTQVCAGTNSTLLTLSGHTGSVVIWQSSTNHTTWSDISNTATTYTAQNLTENTWFRAVVQTGTCAVNYSKDTQITIGTNFKISGTACYDNNPKTRLDGLKITLKQGSTTIQTPVVTGSTGYYEFSGLSNGTYSLTIESSHPSGNWQTWGGVTNGDFMLVSSHITGTQLLPENPPVIKVAASVKVPHPAINSADEMAIRQAVRYPQTGYSLFDIPKWVFSGLDATSALDNIEVQCASVVRDIRGLCAGDVNGSLIPPAGHKTAGMIPPGSLQLLNQGTILVTNEMAFAVRLVETQGLSQPIGAITLFMNYDPTMVEITNVTMPMNGGTEPWFETDNGALYIGWISTEPVSVVENQTVLLVHARLLAPVETHGSASLQSPANPIRFTLNETMVSELADASGNVIDEAKLAMPGAGSNGETGKWQNGETAKRQNGKVVCYPNPVQSTLNIELFTSNPHSSTCNLELVNLHGVSVLNLQPPTFSNGWHKVQFDVRDLMPGAYCLRAWVNGELFVKKVIITR